MRRLRRLDLLLVLLIVPAWLVACGLYVREVWTGRLAWVGLFVTAGDGAQGYPRLRGFWEGTRAQSCGLREGDALRSVGGTSLRGVGPVGFTALAYAGADADLAVPLIYERDGHAGAATLHLTPAVYPWRILPLVVAFAFTGLFVLLRIPDVPVGRTFFLAATTMAAQWTFFGGGPPAQTYAWAVVFFVASALMLPFCLRLVLIFPEETAPPGGRLPWWPWLFALFGPAAFSWVFGVPVPPPYGQQAAFAVNVAGMVAVLFVVTRNYFRAGPIGRRQIKWVVYGLYLGLVPVVAADAFSVLVPGLWWHEVAAIAEVAVPLSILVAILRFNLFDIDRLIAATAAYSIVSILFLATLFTVVVPAGRWLSVASGIDPMAVQMALSAVLATCLVPGKRLIGPRIERLFFAERVALQNGVDVLLRELAATRDAAAAYRVAGERLHALLRARPCAVYVRGEAGWTVAFAAGTERARVRLPEIAADAPAIGAIALRAAPLDLQGVRGAAGRVQGAEASALADLGAAAVIVPVRRGEKLAAFVVLGEKQSGDVYTSTDLTLLGSVSAVLGGQLLRLDLGRYVASEVIDRIIQDPDTLVPKEREVTILFSDMAGSTTIAERLSPADLRALQDEYFDGMAAIVSRHGGMLVKTIGDAVMALWNAPVAVDGHAVRGCRAALDMLAALAAMNGRWHERGWPAVKIRIGLHSATAMVGNFGTSQRIEYDARGDAVNLASRLEGVNKLYGTTTVVSDGTRRALADEFVCRPLDQVRVVGRAEPVGVHELLGRRADDVDGRLRRLEDRFALAVAAYRSRAWDEAVERFEHLAHEFPDDGPTRVYLARCRALVAQPPAESWDGVYDATSK